MWGEYPKGGAIFLGHSPLWGGHIPRIFVGISPPFERGRISWGGGEKSCDNGMGK